MTSPPATAPRSSAWSEVRSWRVQERERLIAERMALDPALRAARAAQVCATLAGLELRRFGVLGIYWPIRGEIDVRELAAAHHAAGGRVVLPAVVAKGAPVEFRSWRPGAPMGRDLWKIPVPRERELLRPEGLLVPLVGFDGECYRLGYGGGYYDRPLAALAPRPFCVGLGFDLGRLHSIVPQPHDIRMDVIVTETQRLPQ
ncbi:MAG TPA: 5-formyltetrahydrofolate cyclo-ligase [Steroidobacteraceae bacterium]|nr:5-formyltetrahydrofolate cyclo-ligase [Steroidobacteraceae bacterium]